MNWQNNDLKFLKIWMWWMTLNSFVWKDNIFKDLGRIQILVTKNCNGNQGEGHWGYGYIDLPKVKIKWSLALSRKDLIWKIQ